MISSWRKSSRSQGGGQCVEVRLLGAPQLSDSTLPDKRPILTVDRETFQGFLHEVKSGAHNLP